MYPKHLEYCLARSIHSISIWMNLLSGIEGILSRTWCDLRCLKSDSQFGGRWTLSGYILSASLTNPCQVRVPQASRGWGGKKGWCPGIVCSKFWFLISDLLSQSLRSKRALESEFLSGSPGDSHIDLLQFENHLLKESYSHSILASPSGICGCENYKKLGHLFYTGHPGFASWVCQL